MNFYKIMNNNEIILPCQPFKSPSDNYEFIAIGLFTFTKVLSTADSSEWTKLTIHVNFTKVLSTTDNRNSEWSHLTVHICQLEGAIYCW